MRKKGNQNSQEASHRASSRKQPMIPCKKEPLDSEDFGKTLRALNENLDSDGEFMTSLMSDENSVINEILAKLKDVPLNESGKGNKRKRSTPRRKSARQADDAKTSNKGATNTANKKENRKESSKNKKDDKKTTNTASKRIKNEPVEYKDEPEEEEADNFEDDLDDVSNDPDFLSFPIQEDNVDDENDTVATTRSGKKRTRRKKKEGPPKKRGRKPKGIERNRSKEYEGIKVREMNQLKEKLETLGEAELAEMGIRKLTPGELSGEFC